MAIFGKGPGKQDDTFMSLQIAVYWAQYKIADDAFLDYCERNGWWSPGDELLIHVAIREPYAAPVAAAAAKRRREIIDSQ
jgi:hypothetical protein